MDNSILRHQIIALLRAALGLLADDSLPQVRNLFAHMTDADWQDLHQEACAQSVEALVYEGLGHLGFNGQGLLPKQVRMMWISGVMNIEKTNAQLSDTLSHLAKGLDKRQIPYIVMKGQVAGSRYPIPSRRASGDIDILVRPEHFAEVEQWLVSKGAVVGDIAPEKHTELFLGPDLVELHHTIVDLFNPEAMKYLRAYDYFSESVEVEVPGAGMVRTLSPSFDCAYSVAHMVHHILTEGLGLRQLCDFVMLLARQSDAVSQQELMVHLRSLGLVRAFSAFVRLSISEFGLDGHAWQCYLEYSSPEDARRILDYVFEVGNFGKKGSGYRHPEGLKDNINNAKVYLNNCRRFHRICPSEVRWMLGVRACRWLAKKS